MRFRRSLPGAFTVEASFIASFTVIILAALIFLGMYLHDRAVLRLLSEQYLMTALELTERPCGENGMLDISEVEKRGVRANASYEKDTDEEAIRAALLTAMKERTLMTTVREVSVRIEDKSAEVSYSCAFRFPTGGIFGRLLSDSYEMEGVVSCKKRILPETCVRVTRALLGRNE